MFNSMTGRTLTADDPPGGARHRRFRRLARSILALASTLAMGIAMTVVAPPAQALTAIDGQWTVVHGGTGHLTLKADGTFTSTCQVTPGYTDAWCPAPSGTFQYSTMGSAGVTFTGADGSTAGYRVSGLFTSPDTITSYFGSRTQTPLIMKKGTAFVCTDWGVRDRTPMAYADETGTLLYATGSHDFLGPVDRGNDVAETAPNYFQLGQCGNLYPKLTLASFIHIDNFRDATGTPTSTTWSPRVAVTIKDLAGVPVSGATVSAWSTEATPSCVTVADGTCTLGGYTLANSITSTELNVSPDKSGTVFFQEWGPDPLISPTHFTVYNPLVGPPPPPPPPPPPGPPAPPATHHIGDLDNVTVKSASSRTWKPRVAVTVLDESGVAVEGAIVNGSFSHVRQGQTCTTEANGTCTIGEYLSLSRSFTSTVFTVTDVLVVSSTYVPTANSDPDGDSNGTTETVKLP